MNNTYNGYGGPPNGHYNRDLSVSKEEPVDESNSRERQEHEFNNSQYHQNDKSVKDEPRDYGDQVTLDLVDDNSYPHHSKHVCQVCGDRASGKHYGLYSCEGCKGFFKRTVRKELTYSCRDNRQCVIDKRQRNRCQYCRYQKCLSMGMRREAVQGETNNDENRRQITEPLSPVNQSNPYDDMPVEEINDAENEFDRIYESDNSGSQVTDYLAALTSWAKTIPRFETLKGGDGMYLVHSAWNEITIADIAHRSIDYEDLLLTGKNESLSREQALATNVEVIFERVMTELVQKMREMNLDRTELGCLKAIILYNPDIKELEDSPLVEELREKVYASLEAYAKQKYPDQPGRFAKLLLRLPALRSIGLKCIESTFLYKTVGDAPQLQTVRAYF